MPLWGVYIPKLHKIFHFGDPILSTLHLNMKFHPYQYNVLPLRAKNLQTAPSN